MGLRGKHCEDPYWAANWQWDCEARSQLQDARAKEGTFSGMALNCEEAPLDVDIKNGGKVVVLNTMNLHLVGDVGLGADLVRLNGNAMYSPGFSCDSVLQVTYIVRGSGRVQVVGVDGKRMLDTTHLVLSVKLDEWTDEQVDALIEMG